MNELAQSVENFIVQNGIKKVWLIEKLGISQPYFYKLMHKKNFNVDDANRILAPMGYKVSYTFEKVQ